MLKIYFKKNYVSKDLLRTSKLKSKHFKTNIGTTLILPLFLWKIIEIYNGKKYVPINISEKKVGFLLKDFIFQQKNKSFLPEFNIKIYN